MREKWQLYCEPTRYLCDWSVAASPLTDGGIQWDVTRVIWTPSMSDVSPIWRAHQAAATRSVILSALVDIFADAICGGWISPDVFCTIRVETRAYNLDGGAEWSGSVDRIISRDGRRVTCYGARGLRDMYHCCCLLSF